MKTYMQRVPKEYDEEAKSMVDKVQALFGIKVSKVKALKIILLKSKKTTYTLTEKELISILGS